MPPKKQAAKPQQQPKPQVSVALTDTMKLGLSQVEDGRLTEIKSDLAQRLKDQFQMTDSNAIIE